jgi:DEAD/DEAH box helicase domain-containing protein
MSKVLSFDIETKNLSYEIGGWDNQHLFKVACVTTWDGNKGIIYVDEPMNDSISKAENTEVKSLRQLKFDLDDHFQKGGVLLGHNINAFDLPVLRDSMDIYIVRKYLEDKSNRCIDTSAYMTKHHGRRIHLDNLVKCTLGDSKSMSGIESVKKWREGLFGEVVDYCMKDSKLTYDLWKYGQENGIVKYYNEEKDEHVEAKVEW